MYLLTKLTLLYPLDANSSNHNVQKETVVNHAKFLFDDNISRCWIRSCF